LRQAAGILHNIRSATPVRRVQKLLDYGTRPTQANRRGQFRPPAGARHIVACDAAPGAGAPRPCSRLVAHLSQPSRDRASPSIGSPCQDAVDRRDVLGGLCRRRRPNRDDVGEPLSFRQDGGLAPSVYPGDIIPEQRAKSSRNTERHQIEMGGDIIPDSRATSPGISILSLAQQLV
jgi:hypothetical protein